MNLTQDDLQHLETIADALKQEMLDIEEIVYGVRNLLLNRRVKAQLQEASNIVGIGIIGNSAVVDWDLRDRPRNAMADASEKYPVLTRILKIVDDDPNRVWQGEVYPVCTPTPTPTPTTPET